jgi:hypothetical protein
VFAPLDFWISKATAGSRLRRLELLPAVEIDAGANRITQSFSRYLPCRQIEIGGSEELEELPDVDLVLFDPVEVQPHGDIRRLDPVDAHAPHAGDPLQTVHHALLDQGVVLREVQVLGADAAFDDRDVIRVEGHQEDVPDVRRQLGSDLVDLLLHFHAEHIDLASPLEHDANERPIAVTLAEDLLHAAQGREHFLDRTGDVALYLLRDSVGIGHLHADERELRLGQEVQGQPAQADCPDHQE